MKQTKIFTPYGYGYSPLVTTKDIYRGFLISNGDNPRITTIPISNRTLFFDNISETERVAEHLELSERFRSSRIFKWKGITCKKLYSDNDLTIFQAAGISQDVYMDHQINGINQYIIDHELYIYAYIHNDMTASDIARNWFDPDFDSGEKIFTRKTITFDRRIINPRNDDIIIPIIGKFGTILSSLSLDNLVTMGLGNYYVFKICGSLDFPNVNPAPAVIVSENMTIDMKKIWHVGRAMIMYGHGTHTVNAINNNKTVSSHNLLLWIVTYNRPQGGE